MLRTNQIQHLLVKNDDSNQADVGVTYPAYMYNALVDEYNSLTDGEKMNHVSKDVLEIEYDQLEACVEALYEKENAKAKKNTKKQCKIMKTNWLKKNMNNNKQNKENEASESDDNSNGPGSDDPSLDSGTEDTEVTSSEDDA